MLHQSYCEIPMTFLQLANMANEEVVMGPGSGLTASDIHAAEAAAYAATPASGSSERSCDTLTSLLVAPIPMRSTIWFRMRLAYRGATSSQHHSALRC